MNNFSKTIATVLLTFSLSQVFCQTPIQESKKSVKDSSSDYKFSVHTTWLSFSNFGNPETNTHHYEIGFRYNLTSKDRIGVKLTTWKLFAPMGILFWDPLFLDRDEFYPGRLQERGLGITYQRTLWKGLFTTLEVLPLIKTYLNEENEKIGDGFKLYISYHVGYHIPIFKGRGYIEPQIHVNYWPIDSKAPESFRVKDAGKRDYFLFEPNIYFGVNF